MAGGITYTIDERNFFETFCFTKDKDSKKVKEIINDRIIGDIFSFTSFYGFPPIPKNV